MRLPPHTTIDQYADEDARESEVKGSQFEKDIGEEITGKLVSPAYWHLSRSIVP